MTSLDRSNTPNQGEIEAAFASHLERGAIDIVQDEDSGDLEVRSDTWTLAMQGIPPTVAFFAIDDEPDDTSQLDAALRSATAAGDMQALQQLNRTLDGAIATALRQSGDPLSIALADKLG